MRTIKDKTTWLDINHPKEPDLKELKQFFDVSPALEEEIKIQLSRQKLEKFNDFIFLVIRFPVYNQSKKTSMPIEIDFLIKENALATIRYSSCEPLDDLFKKTENLEGFRSKVLGKTSAEALEIIFEELFNYANRELAHIDKKINQISEGIFKNKEKEMIRQISQTKRDVLDFRRIMKPVHGALKDLAEEQGAVYSGNKSFHFKRILENYMDAIDWVENQKDTLESLETTNSSMLSTKLDEVTKILSWLAFFLAPVTIIGTLFQINTQFTPVIGQPGDWWIVLGFMGLACGLLYWFLKRKRWI